MMCKFFDFKLWVCHLLEFPKNTVFSPIDGPPIGVSRTFTSYGLRNRFFVFFMKYFCVSRQELQNKWSVRFLGPGNAEKHHFGRPGINVKVRLRDAPIGDAY